ncbi:MAG: hypothetical protein ACRDNK_03615 [Solirubrobacteraceae bacterium]
MSTDKRGADQAMVETKSGEQPKGRRRRRFHRPARAAALVALVLATGAAAATAAAVNSALTGTQVKAGDPNAQAIGTGQDIAMGAPDTVSVGIKFTQDIRFAPGYESWKAATVAFETSLGPPGPGSPPPGKALMTSGMLRRGVAEAAVCSWLKYYVASQTAGDSAAATSAAAQIDAAPSWPAMTALSFPNSLGLAVAAVDRGDANLVQALINTAQAGNCLVVGPLFSPGDVSPAGLSEADQQAQLAEARHLGQQEIATDPVAQRLGINGIPTTQAPSAAPPPSGG